MDDEQIALQIKALLTRYEKTYAHFAKVGQEFIKLVDQALQALESGKDQLLRGFIGKAEKVYQRLLALGDITFRQLRDSAKLNKSWKSSDEPWSSMRNDLYDYGNRLGKNRQLLAKRCNTVHKDMLDLGKYLDSMDK